MVLRLVPYSRFHAKHLDHFRQEFADGAKDDNTFTYLRECCAHAWHKIEKYYRLADETPIVYAAVMLNPTSKQQWFKEHWILEEQSDWLRQVTDGVKDLWREFYMPTPMSKPASTIVENDQDNMYIRLHNHKRVRLSPNTSAVDQLDEYLATDLVPDSDTFNPLQYWFERRHTTPELARFAFDTLALPMMSDDPERSFSAGRDMVTYRRSNLLDDIIQACMCLRSWYGPPTPKKKGKNYEFEEFDEEIKIQEAYSKARKPSDGETKAAGRNSEGEGSDLEYRDEITALD